MNASELRRLSGKELCSLRVAVVKEEIRREPMQEKAFYAAFRRCMADDIVKIRESKDWTVHKAATEAGITDKNLTPG